MSNRLKNKNHKTFFIIFSIPLLMFLLSFASVPLYNLFCKVTGYGGTVKEANKVSSKVINRDIKVRFNSDIARKLDINFKPTTTQLITKLGKTNTIEYKVRNNSNKEMSIISTYNVTPQKAGIYFNKLDCFCYEEKVLKPGEETLLPVSFFISPELIENPNTENLKSITLSYTFFDTKNINVSNFN